MTRVLMATLLLAACSSANRSHEFACEVTADCEAGRTCTGGFCVVAAVDAAPGAPDVDAPNAPAGDAPSDCATWSAAHFDPCALPNPGGLDLMTPGTYVYDTTSATLADPQGVLSIPPNTSVASGRVISVAHLAIGAGVTLRVVGNAPLIVAAWTTIDVAAGGAIDVGSTAASAGAGADPTTACAQHAAVRGHDDIHGASGGGGGAYQGKGGVGGATNSPALAGGTGASAFGAAPLLAGGCPGADGGTGDQPGGPGGHGGGALQLTARMSIAIAGTLAAGGAGGAGGISNGTDADGGGGGGGAGGMIGLESPHVTIADGAIVAANGAGGGEGADTDAGAPGTDGLATTTAAPGGTGGTTTGGDGGDGAAATKLAGGAAPGPNDNGAGGGGGGAGYIVIASPDRTLAGTLSPPATLAP